MSWRGFFIAGVLLSTVAVQAVAENRSPILRPNPADLLQIRDFEPEWCASPGANAARVRALCYGKSTYRGAFSVRSLVLELADGRKALYIEDEPPAVELLKPEFGVVGPVNAGTRLFPETGRASLSFDAEGEVEELRLSLPSLGQLGALRPTR